jgi:hypothetical protein
LTLCDFFSSGSAESKGNFDAKFDDKKMMSCNVVKINVAQMEFKAVSRKISSDLQFSTVKNVS